MKKIFSYIIIIAIFAMASCKVGPNFKKPVLDNPDAFLNDSLKGDTVAYDSVYNDSLMNLVWWELFEDNTLQAIIKKAVENNKDYLIAISRIEEARASLGYTKADLYPNFGIKADAKRAKLNLLGSTDAFNNFSISPTMSWEIDFWGKIRRSTEAARATLIASEYGKQKIMTSLISEVIGTYFLLIDYKARYDISQKTYNSRKEYLTIIQARFDHGTVPQIDLNHAQIQEAQAESSIYLYERLIKQTEYTLSILLGQNPSTITGTNKLVDQIVPPEVPPGLPSQLLERRPDVREAEQLLAAQNAKIGVAQAMRFPSISLTGLLGVGSSELNTLFSPDAIIWSAGGQLLGPIFNFNKNKRRVEIEKHRTEQMLLSYERTVLVAFKEVEDALVAISTYKNELAARKRQVVAANNAAMLAKARYDKGISSYLEVLESNRQLFDAELIAAQTLDEFLFSYVKLYKALGGGW